MQFKQRLARFDKYKRQEIKQNYKTEAYNKVMIFPTDYRQRMQKEEKTRQYKAMLDEQIRQNNLINQQAKFQRRNHRIRTQPIESYQFRERFTAPTRQLQHESTFLPSLSHNNHIIDHSFRYLASPDTPSRRFFENLSAKKYSEKKYNDEDLDDSLDRCLEQCDQLIHGINKNFIHLNNHLRLKPNRTKNYDLKNFQRSRHYSEFDVYNKGQDSRISRGLESHLPVTSLRGSQLLGIESDVGRNEMMNYNVHKTKQKEILHMSTPGEGINSPAERDNYNNALQKTGSRTKKKIFNDYLADKVKTTPNKLNNNMNFDTINSSKERDSGSQIQNQFTNIYLPKGMSSQLNQSVEKMKKEAKRMAEQLKQHQEMKKKDNKILEHLRKAKNKGSILFKKIQVFRKQREQLQGSKIVSKDQKGGTQGQKSKAVSRNTQKNPIDSRNSNVLQDKRGEGEIKKEQTSVQGSKNQNYKQPSKAGQVNSRANSKLSQKE